MFFDGLPGLNINLLVVCLFKDAFSTLDVVHKGISNRNGGCLHYIHGTDKIQNRVNMVRQHYSVRNHNTYQCLPLVRELDSKSMILLGNLKKPSVIKTLHAFYENLEIVFSTARHWAIT
jgi:hypothetical protein